MKHSDINDCVKCDSCGKKYSSEVTLKKHLKYAHKDRKQESCSRCSATFKQKKNLRAHLLNIHNIDQMREMYCEDEDKKYFKCKDCDSEFSYKKSLTVHRKNKHEGKISVFECDLCNMKFGYKHKLLSHMKSKHKL